MIPPLIVQVALERGINLIAITDHNATANVEAVQKAARNSGLSVLAGVELQTREEVHSLCLFDSLEQARAFQEWIDAHLPEVKNNVEFFGEQFVVDETGDFIRREERLLINSMNVSLRQAWEEVTRLEGLFIPAHIDRPAFGLLTNLGLVPTDFQIEALEITRRLSPQDACQRFTQIKDYPLIQDGDVHFLDDFLGSTVFQVESPTIDELRMAIHSQAGRSAVIQNPLCSGHDASG